MAEILRKTDPFAAAPDTAEDARYMRMALEEAKKGAGTTSPNPLVGAVVVRGGEVLGRGFHARCGGDHAEVNALRQVFEQKKSAQFATLYVTLEPCSTIGRTPPCTELIKGTMIRRVVIGTLDPNPKHNGRAVEILERAGIEVKVGVEEAACRDLNAPFFRWITTGKPLVVLKMAQTLDGKIADTSGNACWITGEGARARVQELRRRADAVLVGANTLRMDYPHLTCRRSDGQVVQEHKLRRFVASTKLTAEEARSLIGDHGEVEVVDLSSPQKWQDFLQKLGQENVTMLLLEGGAGLAASAVRAGVVDRYEFHLAPKVLGGAAKNVLADCGISQLNDAVKLKFLHTELCGGDLILTAEPEEA